MNITLFDIPDIFQIIPRRYTDERGFFSEVYREDTFRNQAGVVVFVQDNHSLSRRKGTIRGLHYQKPPRAQGKLVRVSRGAILDVAVDVREGSPAHGRHVAVELSADNGKQLWVPPGFLHGFCTLADDTEVLYKVTDYHSPEHDGAVSWNDPALGIAWPALAAEATVSDKDRRAPGLSDVGGLFIYRAA